MGPIRRRLFTRNGMRNYSNWVGCTAEEVKHAAIQLGGWSRVFITGLPMDIHRVRNYFNLYPLSLRWIKGFERERALRRVIYHKGGGIESLLRNHWNLSRRTSPSEAWALQGEVYKDSDQRYWYLMTPISGSYHVGDGEAGFWVYLKATLKPGSMPAKLISPDGTGGSHELIMSRPRGRALSDYLAGRLFQIEIDDSPLTRGSYNFAETVSRAAGILEHERLDVAPHKREKVYHNPSSAPRTPLSARFFPTLTEVARSRPFRPPPRKGPIDSSVPGLRPTFGPTWE